MRRYWSLLSLLALFAVATGTDAAPGSGDRPLPMLNAEMSYQGPIAHRVAFIAELGEELSVGDIQHLIRTAPHRLERTDARVLTRGVNAGAIWITADILNLNDAPVTRRLTVRTGWLDRVDFYFLGNGRPLRRLAGGDSLPVYQRFLGKRIATADHAFHPGVTRLMLRVETADPLVVPFYFSSPEDAHEREQFETAFHSFVYGVMLALAVYNLLLFAGLRRRRYLYYFLFMLAFVAMTAAYNGIGMALFWPSAQVWQQWAPPLLILCFAFTGLAFATSFLQTRRRRRRLYRLTQMVCSAYLCAFAACYLLGERGWAMWLALSLAPVFTLLMLYLGISSWLSGMQSARYYLLGTVASATGASVTALTVSGLVGYSRLGYYAVDIGMVLDAMLLALALADLVRRTHNARVAAERRAQVDHLTGLENRRGFVPVAQSLWGLVKRKNRDMCVAMIDIDHFKAINDQFGHATGDRVLRGIARVLDNSRRHGDLLARWGGEEFVLLLPETDLEEACQVAERLRQNVEALTVREGADRIQCTVSIGVANRDSEDVSLDKTLVMADQALYQAKMEGRNRVCAGPTTGTPVKAASA
ncbi:MAG: diguanylate cyclase [Pseudomonadota bacterium]|nr:diguanylate cyclase [Pseudomonadota bacterium]